MKLFKRSKASNFIFEYFSKICRENSSSLKSDKNNGYFTGHQYTFLTFFFIISRSIRLRIRNISY